jgi:hypothetical protein
VHQEENRIYGMYSMKEAETLFGVPWARIRHWIRGDLRINSVGRNLTPPLIKSDIGKIAGKYHLSFNDMIEIRMIYSFQKAGVSIHRIRRAYEFACKVFDTYHPFSTNKFFTDHKGIWAELPKSARNEVQDDKALLDMLKGQYELPEVTRVFINSVDFEDHQPRRWWPMERDGLIVLDARRNMGHPIVHQDGIATDILANGVLAELSSNLMTLKLSAKQSFERIAYWYDIDKKAVEAAFLYETQIIKRLAA